MTENDFKVGDVVSLKSGSPKMTIVEIGTYNYSSALMAKCKWFFGENHDELMG